MHLLTLSSTLPLRFISIARIGFDKASKNQFLSLLNSATLFKAERVLGSLFRSEIMTFLKEFAESCTKAPLVVKEAKVFKLLDNLSISDLRNPTVGKWYTIGFPFSSNRVTSTVELFDVTISFSLAITSNEFLLFVITCSDRAENEFFVPDMSI
jgi:hypothetical protein